jgi:hypothetical protein
MPGFGHGPFGIGLFGHGPGPDPGLPEAAIDDPNTLGFGEYDAIIYDRGGSTAIGAVTQVSALRWTRVRDDISEATVTVTRPGPACCDLLSEVRAVRHELVLFRNGKRVWEGPITYIKFTGTTIEIKARDVMWWTSHRAMGRNLDYEAVAAPVLDVVELLLDDVFSSTVGGELNVLPYLTKITSAADINTRIKRGAYTATVWDVVDGFAENGGIDYTAVGRRIFFHDVHTAISETQILTDDHFNADLALIEYGSDLYTRRFRATTDGDVRQQNAPTGWLDYYGYIDEIRAPDDEQVQDVSSMPTVDALEIGYPAPMVLQVPENAGLSPLAPVTIEQLIPGIHVPVKSVQSCREFAQWTKLDSVTGVWTTEGEVVTVSLSTAPARREAPVMPG